MRLIELTQGLFTKVDDSDFEELSKYSWYAMKQSNKDVFYAARTINLPGRKTKSISMHRHLLSPKDNKFVDHKNHDTLDNQRCNLRLATNSQNQANSIIKRKSSSKYRGVHWVSNRKKWRVGIKYNRIKLHIGMFEDENSAAIAYNKKAIELFGEFATLNEVSNASNR